MTNNIDVLFSHNTIKNKIISIAKLISKDFEYESIVLICILEGARIFSSALEKELIKLGNNINIEYIKVSSYKASTTLGYINFIKDLDFQISDKNIILVEDIIDSGLTISSIYNKLKNKKPKALKICTLLDKQCTRLVNDFTIDYKGFIVPNRFIVGFGLDFRENYRNLDYIGVLNFEKKNN